MRAIELHTQSAGYRTFHSIGGTRHRYKSTCTTVILTSRTVTVRHQQQPLMQVARRERYDDEITEESVPRCVSMSLQTILYVLQASCSFTNFVHKFQDTSEEPTPRDSHVTKRYSIVVPGLEVYHAKFKTGPNTPLRRFSAASPSKPGQDLTSHLHLWPSVADNASRMRIASRANDYTDVRRVRYVHVHVL